MPNALTLASWNIGGGVLGASHQINGEAKLDYHLAFLAEQQPDVICLQESHSFPGSGRPSQAAILADGTGYPHLINVPISSSHLDASAELSLAVLSRFPILESGYHQFPNPGLESQGPNGEAWTLYDKGLLRATVRAYALAFTLINAHCFPFHYFGVSAAAPDFSHIWHQLNATLLSAAAAGPTLAAIDLNSPEFRILLAPSLGSLTNAVADTPSTPKGEQQDYLLYSSPFQLHSTRFVPTAGDHSYCEFTVSF